MNLSIDILTKCDFSELVTVKNKHFKNSIVIKHTMFFDKGNCLQK